MHLRCHRGIDINHTMEIQLLTFEETRVCWRSHAHLSVNHPKTIEQSRKPVHGKVYYFLASSPARFAWPLVLALLGWATGTPQTSSIQGIPRASWRCASRWSLALCKHKHHTLPYTTILYDTWPADLPELILCLGELSLLPASDSRWFRELKLRILKYSEIEASTDIIQISTANGVQKCPDTQGVSELCLWWLFLWPTDRDPGDWSHRRTSKEFKSGPSLVFLFGEATWSSQ